MAKFVIETESKFRLRYAIEAESHLEAEEKWHRLDNDDGVEMGGCEIFQTHVSEEITSTTQVDDQGLIDLSDEYMREYVLNRVYNGE